MTKRRLLTSLFLLPAAIAFSAGYQINVQGVRQVAMGGTGCGLAWDASTIFYNPGGLSDLNNWQAYGSVNLLFAQTRYAQVPTQGLTEDSKMGVYAPFNIYVGGPLAANNKIGVGLGIYTPFGSGLTWENSWSGRFVTQSINLKSVFFQPTVSYKVCDFFSIGGGFVYAMGGVDLKKGIPLQDENGINGQAHLKGNANGLGYNIGAQIRIDDQWQIGISYRSRVNMKVKNGTANFYVPSSLETNFPNTSFSTTLPLPSVTTIGIAFKATDEITLQADFNYLKWSAYKQLEFDYVDNTSVLTDTKSPRNYNDKMSFRLGGHYIFNDKFCLMAGAAYDPTPVADGYVSPDLPDANHWIMSGGLTYELNEKITFMGAIEYNTTVRRNAQYTPDNFNGTYQTKVVLPSFGMTYDF